MMSELGSKGVDMEVTQPAWPTSSPRCTRLSAILDYHYSSFTVRFLTAILLHLAAGLCFNTLQRSVMTWNPKAF